jgi:hypothetical protein
MKPEHIAWSRQTFDTLRDGGVWMVPSGGLIFTKRGGGLVLTQAMPWMEEMPVGRDELIKQQDGMYDAIKQHFEAAGVPVSKGLSP